MLKGLLRRLYDVLLAENKPSGIKISIVGEYRVRAYEWLKETKELLALRRNWEVCEIRIANHGIQIPSHRCEQHQRSRQGSGPIV